MSEDFGFERFFSTNKRDQPLLPSVEVQERVDADERRIIGTEYFGIMRQEEIEVAITAEFIDRARLLLGDYSLNLNTPDVKLEDLDCLVADEGLTAKFDSLRELALFVVRRRVASITDREGLDSALTVREGLRSALIKKYTEQVEQERSVTT